MQRRGQGPESASRAGSWVSAIAGRWRRGLTAAGRLAGRIRRWPERVPPRLRWVAAVGGLVAACLLLFAVSAYMTLWVGVRAEVVTTPDLVGLPLDEARRVATSLGLELERIATRTDPRIGQGRVLRQEPQASAKTKVGRIVRVTESLGPQRATQPALVGGSLRRAQIALAARNLRVATTARVPVAGVPAGQVVAQDPPQGLEQWPGAGASLLLSAGDPVRAFVMPDLAGRGYGEVKRWASRHGLRLGRINRIPSPGELPGAVLGQRPLPGYPLDPSLPIVLTITEGEEVE